MTVAGTGLTSTSQVTFDGNPAPFLVLSDTAVSAVTPLEWPVPSTSS